MGNFSEDFQIFHWKAFKIDGTLYSHVLQYFAYDCFGVQTGQRGVGAYAGGAGHRIQLPC